MEGKRKREGGRKKEGWIARKGGNVFTVYLELCAYRALSTIRSQQVERGESVPYDRKRVVVVAGEFNRRCSTPKVNNHNDGARLENFVSNFVYDTRVIARSTFNFSLPNGRKFPSWEKES